MISYITNHAITEELCLPGLQACLAQQLEKVKNHEAKIKNRNNGGSPKRQQDWR